MKVWGRSSLRKNRLQTIGNITGLLVCTHRYVGTYTHTHMHTHAHIHMHINVDTHKCICTHMYLLVTQHTHLTGSSFS